MLAEILIVRLETAARPSGGTIPSSSSQFVPFRPDGQFSFKDEGSGSVGGLSAVEGGKDRAQAI